MQAKPLMGGCAARRIINWTSTIMFLIVLLTLREVLAGATSTGTSTNENRGILISKQKARFVFGFQIDVSALVVSTNRGENIYCIECFLDPTNVMKSGSRPYNTNSVVAQASLIPGPIAKKQHEIFIHACGTNMVWSPFACVTIKQGTSSSHNTSTNVSVNDVLNRIRRNYRGVGGL